MFADLLNSSYFALFLIVALGFMLGRIKIKGLSLDVSAVIFIALLFGHFGVIIPKELGNFGLVLFIFTIGIQAGPGFFDSFRSKGKNPDHNYHADYLLGFSYSCRAQIPIRHRYAQCGRFDSRCADQYTGTCRSHRQYKFSVGIHFLWYRLSVRRNRCDPFREAIAKNASQGFDS